MKGNTDAEKIWFYLLEKLNNPYGVAGVMGNLYKESRLNPKNLQSSYNNKLNLTDEEYTDLVDKGEYTNFAQDGAGYGLAQWTSSSRKLNLLSYAKISKTSIGDLKTQLEFLYKELYQYQNVMKVLREAKSVKEASDIFMIKFERPANQSEEAKQKRANYGQNYYDALANDSFAKVDKYINSTNIHYISNSGSDENKKYTGGKAGDQTTHEWELRSWYSRPWTHIFRYEKNPKVGEKLADLSCAAALNDNIGYDQYQRTTYWKELQAANYNPSRISNKCEEDCSAGVAANIKAVGYLLGIKELQNVSSSMTSRNTIEQLKKAGFTVLTDVRYKDGYKYLKPGDILLYENHHVAVNITKGVRADDVFSTKTFEIIGTAVAKQPNYIRISPNASAEICEPVLPYQEIEIIEVVNNFWYKIVYPKLERGYAYTGNLNNLFYNCKFKEENATNPLEGTYKTLGKVNLREKAGTAHKILTVLPKSSKVTSNGQYVIVDDMKWLQVKFNQYSGFISSKYLERIGK